VEKRAGKLWKEEGEKKARIFTGTPARMPNEAGCAGKMTQTEEKSDHEF